MYERRIVATLVQRMRETDNPLMQVLVGPRQTGKSTMLSQALDQMSLPHHFVSTDDELSPSADWIGIEWQEARNLQSQTGQPTLLVIDEIQAIPGWENAVKGLWDADRRVNRPLKVVLSGSSSLLIHKGLADSLTGRFELIHSPQWSFAECRDAFGYSLDDFLYFGGYPGAARFVGDERRWRGYLREAIIEPTITKDVLGREDIRRPALLRQLFVLGARYSAQELSFNKMLGQLQDSGNTATLAHYLELLDQAGILSGLNKYHPKDLARRRSSPRLMVHDTSLMTASSIRSKSMVLEDLELRGHVVESVVGAHLLARGESEGFDVYWWREGNAEVDFVVESGEFLVAIEVKSGRTKSQGGMAIFLKTYPEARRMVIGGSAAGAHPFEEFLRDEVLFPWER